MDQAGIDFLETICYRPIGIIHSPYHDTTGMPIQPAGATGVAGTVELLSEHAGGLKDLQGFSHLILIYHFHLSNGYTLEVKPFLDDVFHGVFATRAPRRPNPIGLSIVRLTGVQGCTLTIEDVDIVNGTPLLDIKPYVPAFDVRQTARVGWLSNKGKQVVEVRADERFKR
jgi:tRNA-Thr(GGU) m(6)t(6)A37 methyltransferase TsaA